MAISIPDLFAFPALVIDLFTMPCINLPNLLTGCPSTVTLNSALYLVCSAAMCFVIICSDVLALLNDRTSRLRLDKRDKSCKIKLKQAMAEAAAFLIMYIFQLC